jgi:signal transduction histidine kinase
MNLILNAAEAMGGSGKIIVRTYPKTSEDWVRIEISDTGPGIPEDIVDHVFEPFFTTKEEGKGTGLGLSVVYGIVQNHQGRIWVNSEPGKGATFFIEFSLERREKVNGEDGSKN